MACTAATLMSPNSSIGLPGRREEGERGGDRRKENIKKRNEFLTIIALEFAIAFFFNLKYFSFFFLFSSSSIFSNLSV